MRGALEFDWGRCWWIFYMRNCNMRPLAIWGGGGWRLETMETMERMGMMMRMRMPGWKLVLPTLCEGSSTALLSGKLSTAHFSFSACQRFAHQRLSNYLGVLIFNNTNTKDLAEPTVFTMNLTTSVKCFPPFLHLHLNPFSLIVQSPRKPKNRCPSAF